MSLKCRALSWLQGKRGAPDVWLVPFLWVIYEPQTTIKQGGGPIILQEETGESMFVCGQTAPVGTWAWEGGAWGKSHTGAGRQACCTARAGLLLIQMDLEPHNMVTLQQPQ